jgi:hypothetical protein
MRGGFAIAETAPISQLIRMADASRCRVYRPIFTNQLLGYLRFLVSAERSNMALFGHSGCLQSMGLPAFTNPFAEVSE